MFFQNIRLDQNQKKYYRKSLSICLLQKASARIAVERNLFLLEYVYSLHPMNKLNITNKLNVFISAYFMYYFPGHFLS